MVGVGDHRHISQPPTEQPHQGRAVRQTRMRPQQSQGDVVQGQHMDLPERTVPGQTSAEHGFDVAADFEGGLGGRRRSGEDVVGEVEASVDDPGVTATRLTDELLGEARVRDLGRVGRLQGVAHGRPAVV